MSFGFKFWGVRGSLPTAPIIGNIENYITDTVAYTLDNLGKSKDQIIKELYQNNIVTPFGNNTSCVELINSDDETQVTIFDAGSGLKWLGDDIINNRPEVKRINLFITHTHWDHISGFPFFAPAYGPAYEIHIFSPVENIEKIFRHQQNSENFPISLDMMQADIIFHEIDVKETIEISHYKISMQLNDHPGKAYSYKVTNGEKAIVYMTDAEVNIDNIDIFETYYEKFLRDVDMLIFDAQYDYLQSYSELSDKAGWGHSSSIIGVDICSRFDIHTLLLFHYDPSDVDREIHRHYEQAVYYRKSSQFDFPKAIYNSIEGKEYTVD